MNHQAVPPTDFIIRFARPDDTPLILQYIRDLAAYENELEQVTATQDLLRASLFDKKQAEVVLGERDGKPVGFALFHNSFSTFLGYGGLHLVDLYIEPQARGNGFGKTMLSHIARLAKERGCGRLEWWCHDWNEPAIRRYQHWGARPVEHIGVWRLEGDTLDAFGALYAGQTLPQE